MTITIPNNQQMAATGVPATGVPATVDDVLKLVASTAPDALRTTNMALKKYSTLYQTNDATYLFNNLSEVKSSFMKVLAEHSVRHYIGVLADVARIPAVTSLVFGTDPSFALAVVDRVMDECATLSTKVPRRSRRNDGSGKESPDEASDGAETDAVASSGSSLLEENQRLRLQVLKLELQLAGLQDRLDDSRHVIDKLFDVAKK